MGIKKWQKVQRGVMINTSKATKAINQYMIDNRLTKKWLSTKTWVTSQTFYRIQRVGSKVEYRTIEKLVNAGINIELADKQ